MNTKTQIQLLKLSLSLATESYMKSKAFSDEFKSGVESFSALALDRIENILQAGVDLRVEEEVDLAVELFKKDLRNDSNQKS